MILEFPEFLPDLPSLNNPGITLAKNVIASGGSYKSFPDFSAYSTALTAYCRGAFSARDPESATTYNFAGDATKLYLLGKTTTGTFDDISIAGGYALGTDEVWEFTQFGDYAIACCINENIQKYEMGVDALFSDLAASAPLARHCDVVRDDFLVVGNTYDAVDGFKPYRIRWPGIGTIDSWTVSATTQADYQDLNAQYGWVQAVLGGQYGVILQEKAIVRMDYVGSPAIFQFTVSERNQGTKYPKSAIRINDLTFFLGLDGFRVFDGNQSVQIGVNKVDRFFLDDLDPNYDYLLTSAVDYDKQIVMWAYPSLELGQGAINSRILMYNYSPNSARRWSYADINSEFIYTALSEGYTLDGLDDWQIANKDPASGTASAVNLDLLPYPLDSRVWVGNTIEFGLFNSDHKLAFPGDTVLTAVLETAEAQITQGQKTDVFLIKPVVDVVPSSSSSTTTITMQLGTRNLPTEAVSWGSLISLDSDGHCQVRSNARYHRVRTTISNNFNHAIGVELLEYKPAGIR